MKNPICVAATAILAFSAIELQAMEREPIIVTATRTAQTEDESLASVTVITRQELERLQSRSLQDALRGVAGLTLANSGGPGKTTSLYLRGTEADHVLVLIDGVRMGSATSGTAPIQDLPIAQIERIEVVRGPRSSLYGSEAIGGVIQIFTRRGGGDPRGDFSLDLGSRASRGASLGLTGGGERGRYAARFAFSDTDGIDACGNGPGAGCSSVEPDADGYRNGSGSLRGGYSFDNGLEFDLHALRSQGENDFDGGFVNQSRTRQQVVGGSLRYAPAARGLLTLTGGRTWDKSDNFKDGVFATTFDTRRDGISLQGDLELGLDRLLTLSVDYQEERVGSTTAYALDSRNDRGYFLQYQEQFSAQEFQFSLRQDDHQAFGRHATGGIAWGTTLHSGVRLRASYATAFKAPTFNELYYPGFGNPDLHPEESASLEFGLQGKRDWGEWSLSAFATRVEELIGFDAHYLPVNIDRARIGGIEARFAAALGAWQTAGNLTLLDPRNRSGNDKDGKLLPRRPRRSLRLDVDREFGAASLGLTLLAEGRRYDDLDNALALAGYGSLDLRAAYRINRGWRLQGRCENLFDQRFETAADYNQPGRSFYLTLRYQS